jgi:uncharacterized membrane-anchored protein
MPSCCQPAGAGAGGTPSAGSWRAWFGGNVVVGAGIGDGAGCAYTDFRMHADGCARFLLLDRELTQRQAGRMLQRLFEIEAYRMLALLALPMARGLSPRMVAIERSLAGLTDGIAREDGRATSSPAARADAPGRRGRERLSPPASSASAPAAPTASWCHAHHRAARGAHPGCRPSTSSWRGASRPAVATCATVSQRLHDLSERVAQASSLLATRVGIARERQNQALLASMDRRAKLQLRLQQTVEGLSVAAIAYYVAGLVGYLAKGAKAAGLPSTPTCVTGIAVPVLALGAWLVLQRVRRHIAAATPRPFPSPPSSARTR